jgi:di/tripeptidase
MRVDLRSTSRLEIDRLERALRISLDHAMDAENRPSSRLGTRRPQTVQCEVVEIGNRPAGELASDSRLLKVIRAVDAVLGNTAQVQRASTDANIPLSLGVPALSMGAGGEGGAAHTLQEWYSSKDREIALKRVLLLTLAMLEWAADQ